MPATKEDAILDAALELFDERTFAGCAVPLVAERAGVATGTIYRYFPSKEALVNVVYQRWKRELKRILVDERPDGLSIRAEFHHWWDGLCRFTTEHPTAFDFLELHHHESYLDDDSRRLALDLDSAALQFALRGQATGELRSTPAALLVALVFGAFAGVVRAMRAYGSAFDGSALAEAEEAVWDLVRAGPTNT